MLIKAECDYALRSLVYLAEIGRRASSLEIASVTGVPQQYLIQIFQRLRDAGLVHATKGKHGGYALALPVSELSALAVVDALEEQRQWAPEAKVAMVVSDRVRTLLGETTLEELYISALENERKDVGE